LVLYYYKMSNFIKIVGKYEHICRLGREIINHKDFIRHSQGIEIYKEWDKQEERIQEFVKATNHAHEEWKNNPLSINPYWTGHS